MHTTFIQTFYQHSSIIWNIICLQEIHKLITMEEYNLIIAGIIGSVITLFLTAIIDFFKEMYRANIEVYNCCSKNNLGERVGYFPYFS